MHKRDMKGMVFGRLTVLRENETRSREGQLVWICRCECGKTTAVKGRNLRTGNTRSCGCLGVENSIRQGRNNARHGHARAGEHSRTYNTWLCMRARCRRPTAPDYGRYGGAGVTVCDRWYDSFDTFLADMGERPRGKTLDRINNDKGYAPWNCRWATPKEQSENRG